MRKIISILAILFAVCGCFKDKAMVNEYYEGKAHDGELQFYITYEVDDVKYEITKLYHYDGWFIYHGTAESVPRWPDPPYVTSDLFNIPLKEAIYYRNYTGENEHFVYFALQAKRTDGTINKWIPKNRYVFNSSEIKVSINPLIRDGKYVQINPQCPYGWFSIRPLNEKYAFEALFEFDIETEDGEIIEFRNGKQVSYYRGPLAVRNREIFTSDL